MTTLSPKYSFVMPAYKSQFLKESIDSILAQSYKDFELIIVDDASPDDIAGVVSSYDDARIRYYRNEENIGGTNLVSQWNHSVEYAQGDWIILATDDDIYENAFLETADRLLNKYPNVDIFRGRIASFNSSSPDSLLYAECCLPEHTCLEEFYYYHFHGIHGGIPQYVFRKSALESIGGFVDFPKAIGSDDATAILIAKNGIVCSGEFLVRFRVSKINISSEGTIVR
ncbi:MAG: glycosyltransferase [Bacteroidales bacterium]|nr:glycosyltransferase [Bacteroidales bacterium]